MISSLQKIEENNRNISKAHFNIKTKTTELIIKTKTTELIDYQKISTR